ncbi:hypothetical protein RIF29_24179 [Crotalaria pallida]|uniref:Uncharacterized protein n=1 Tax=Crotalaria pallida TaxID=3830 RepID=A0AAN9EJV7_CROPI
MSLKVVNKPITDDMKDQPPKFILPKPTWIPNVQEMVKNDPSLVPEMYIRNKPVTGNVKRFVPAQIPVIDLAMLRKGSKEELLKLDMACKDWGFFQKWSNLKYKSVEHRVVANKTKLRSVHEVILMPSSETMHPEPNNVADYVNRYLKRKGSMN